MRSLELLSPARNADIGIAAIDCGADAVYIAGPQFGARKDAGNSIEEIGRLCACARRFGVRVYMTVNILLNDDEMPEVHSMMLEAQRLGVSAFIIRDPRICSWKDITVPLHASTQCSIRDASRALSLIDAGCSRVIPERELTLPQIREIADAVQSRGAEVECFVHGALCVCYSGQCTMSEVLTGRSADRGECIQACRNLYDLEDEDGRTLVRSKALLSLKDLNLIGRIGDLAEAGVCSFKIEGRLKNASYVKNTVRAYSEALDAFIAGHPAQYRRASFGRCEGGFVPSPDKTFNRGWLTSIIDGPSCGWSSMDAPKSMGEFVGKVQSVRPSGRGYLDITLASDPPDLANGDGFAFVRGSSIIGFRGDVCRGRIISVRGLEQAPAAGTRLYRNLSASFEKILETQMPTRLIDVQTALRVAEGTVILSGVTEDGRTACAEAQFTDTARSRDKVAEMIREQTGKRAGIYRFSPASIPDGDLPMLPASVWNSLRRELASKFDDEPCRALPLASIDARHPSFELPNLRREGEVMRSRYCIRRELGICLRTPGSPSKALYLVNNSRRFPLVFDCASCEMAVLDSI